jgi:hypothetical protein
MSDHELAVETSGLAECFGTRAVDDGNRLAGR